MKPVRSARLLPYQARSVRNAFGVHVAAGELIVAGHRGAGCTHAATPTNARRPSLSMPGSTTGPCYRRRTVHVILIVHPDRKTQRIVQRILGVTGHRIEVA